MAGVLAQDVMQQRLPFLKVVAEDGKVRVLRYAPATGDKSAMHSHAEAVVVVLKGGRVRNTFPDGTERVIELKTGDVMIRPPVTHLDEAFDPIERILVEIKHKERLYERDASAVAPSFPIVGNTEVWAGSPASYFRRSDA